MKRKHCEWTATDVALPSARLLTLSLAVVAMTLVVFHRTGPGPDHVVRRLLRRQRGRW